MPENILPRAVSLAIGEYLSMSRLYEIRLRAERPVCVNYGNRYAFLSSQGLTDQPSEAITVGRADISRTILSATEHSIYAYNDDIKKGFITLPSGVRLGVCGEIVSENGRLLTVKNYSSVNIRIPHEIIGCASCIMSDIVAHGCRAMIISAPGAGKTTMLRDIARALSDGSPGRSVLIADERREIACASAGVPTMNVGLRTDVITDGTKAHTFECAIRAMRPDVIVTDELFGRDDVAIVREAIGCGIGVIASAHAADARSFEKREIFADMIKERLFERYYFLSPDFGRRRIAEARDVEFSVCDV